MNLLKDDEVYYISYNFCIINKIDPRELAGYLFSKSFFIDKLLSDEMRDAETNKYYKEIAEIAGLLVSRSEQGILTGRENLETLFQCSEHVDQSLMEIKNANTVNLPGLH